LVVVYSAQRTFELAFGASAENAVDLGMPAGVAISGTILYVADPYAHRVQVYEWNEQER
jgi:hypothetical protein